MTEELGSVFQPGQPFFTAGKQTCWPKRFVCSKKKIAYYAAYRAGDNEGTLAEYSGMLFSGKVPATSAIHFDHIREVTQQWTGVVVNHFSTDLCARLRFHERHYGVRLTLDIQNVVVAQRKFYFIVLSFHDVFGVGTVQVSKVTR